MRWRDRIGVELQALGWDRTVVSVLLLSAFVLLVSDYEGSVYFWNSTLRPHLPAGRSALLDVAPYYWWFAASFVLYLVIPCAWTKLIGGLRVRDLGFRLGDRRLGLMVTGGFIVLMLPVVIAASRFGEFRVQYPLCREALASRGIFAVYEIFYALYFVAWEFLFRGYLLQGLRPRIGGGLAVLVQTLAFAIMHMGKPEVEAYSSIVAGLALGWLALRTGSFWYGAAIHGAVAVAMDLACGLPRLR